MNLTNYHSHCLYCDGRADMASFARFAISKGFTAYGYSSHAPLPFPTAWTMEWDRMDDYLNEFSRLKSQYEGRLELYVGLEIDYLNEESHPAAARFQDLPLDYRIGSVHLLQNAKGEVVDNISTAQIVCFNWEGSIFWDMRIRCITTPSAIVRTSLPKIGMFP